MLYGGLPQSPLLLVVSGAVEGVVEEILEVHQSHPLGRCASNAGSCSDYSGADCSGGGQGKSCSGSNAAERLPNVCMVGPGAVLGGGLFLTYFDAMQLRARTKVTALRFDTKVRNPVTAYLVMKSCFLIIKCRYKCACCLLYF